MKRFLKALVSATICVSVILSMASCIYADQKIYGRDGYTGGELGDPHMFTNTRWYWVETYEEAMTAIEGLKRSGNVIPKICSIISNFENEKVDAKYVFSVNVQDTPRLKKGQNWYDIKYNRVDGVMYIGFLEDVTIEEIEYSYIIGYDRITLTPYGMEEYDPSKDLIYECGEAKDNINYMDIQEKCFCCIKQAETNDFYIEVQYFGTTNHGEELGENFHEELIKSLVYIGD